jgi:hypothetical protein
VHRHHSSPTVAHGVQERRVRRLQDHHTVAGHRVVFEHDLDALGDVVQLSVLIGRRVPPVALRRPGDERVERGRVLQRPGRIAEIAVVENGSQRVAHHLGRREVHVGDPQVQHLTVLAPLGTRLVPQPVEREGIEVLHAGDVTSPR